jgi:DNA replication protein DnaC
VPRRGAVYTPPVAQGSENTEPCPHCGGTRWRLVVRDGVELARACECAEPARRARLLEHARIPKRYRHCTLDAFDTEWNPKDPTLARALRAVREFVDLWPEVDKGLLVMGKVGTGKTHLAVAALAELIEHKGVRGLFADFTALVLEMQMAFDDGDARRELLRPLLDADLLVLDELGARKLTSPFVADLLYYLVNTRYLEERVTIFTTNFSDFVPPGEVVRDAADGETAPASVQESLRDRVSVRIRSRLHEMCRRVELRGDDYRERRLGEGGRKRR